MDGAVLLATLRTSELLLQQAGVFPLFHQRGFAGVRLRLASRENKFLGKLVLQPEHFLVELGFILVKIKGRENAALLLLLLLQREIHLHFPVSISFLRVQFFLLFFFSPLPESLILFFIRIKLLLQVHIVSEIQSFHVFPHSVQACVALAQSA